MGRPSSVTPQQWARIEALARQGGTITSIASELEMHQNTLRYTLKVNRPDLMSLVSHNTKAAMHDKFSLPVEIYDRAVAMLRSDPTLSIAHTARRLGISESALNKFLKQSNLRDEFSPRFKRKRSSLSEEERKKRDNRRQRKIRLQLGEIYRDIRNDKIFLAISTRHLLRPGGGKGKNKDLHKPSWVHTLVGWGGPNGAPLSLEDLLFDWQMTQAQFDALLAPYLAAWQEEVEVRRAISGAPTRVKYGR